jgi:ParB/RepB/Spo0J family partition protein
MSRKPATETYTRVNVDLIDEPDVAMRETFDQDALIALAADIRVNGIVQPLRLAPRGDGRYVIAAGHRRFLAARMNDMTLVPAIVKVSTREEIERIKVAENSHREEVNPAEEGAYYARLLEELCGRDVDALCTLVRRTRTVVEARLVLLSGDPEVLAAVRQREINLGVASELNQIDDEAQRRVYLDAARRGGATVRLVREWRSNWERLRALQQGAEPPGEHYVPPPPQPPGSTLSCVICDSNEDPHDLQLVYMHGACKRLFLARVLPQLRASADAPGEER